MKKSNIESLHTVLKMLVSLFAIHTLVSGQSTKFKPSLTSVNFYDFSFDRLYHADSVIFIVISLIATINIVFARKKNDLRWLIVTPLVVFLLQMLLIFFFEEKVSSWLPSSIPFDHFYLPE